MLLGVQEVNRTVGVVIEPIRQMHIEGIGDAVITCSIPNTGDIQWIFNGGASLPLEATVVTNATTSILTLSPVERSHRGTYTCIVQQGNRSGSANAIVEVIGKTITIYLLPIICFQICTIYRIVIASYFCFRAKLILHNPW